MYQVLDFIADAYTPILFICFGVACSAAISSKKYRLAMKGLVFLVMALLYSYGVMFADQYFLWFAKGALDYSTHTAVALCGIMAIGLMGWDNKRLLMSFVAYLLLMLYQQYHSLLDILVTLVVTSPVLLLLFYSIVQNVPWRRSRQTTAAST